MTISTTLQLNDLIANTEVINYTYVKYKGEAIRIYCNKQDDIKVLRLSTEYKDFYVGEYDPESYESIANAIKAVEQYLKKNM